MKYLLKDKIFIILILTGLMLRLVLAMLPGFHIDVSAWFAWAVRLNKEGFTNFYSDEIWTNYTPGFLYILGFLGFIKNILQINDTIFYFILKIPAIIAETILGIFIYRLSIKKTLVWAQAAVALILLNPAIIFNSTIWGQIDGLLSLMMLLSIYLLGQKKIILSSVTLGLSFLIKPQATAIFPVFGLYLIKNFSLKYIFQSILAIISIVLVLSIPLFTNQPFGLIELFSKMVSDYSYSSLFAYNFWGVVGFWINDSQKWNGLSYQTIGYIFLFVYWITISCFYLKRKLSLYALASLALLGFYFLPTRVHERYLYPALVFLILISTNLKSKLLLFLTFILNIIHFLNLYYVYVYYNEFYLKLPKVLYNPFLYNFLDSNGRILSLISTIIFIIITFVIIKISYVSKKAYI